MIGFEDAHVHWVALSIMLGGGLGGGIAICLFLEWCRARQRKQP